MREGRASRTAEQNALFRALESELPSTVRLFDDPLAQCFLSRPYKVVARLSAFPGLQRLLPWYIDWRWPGVRSSLVARTRWIDDAITGALGEHTRQFVVLGAGFDTRAYRLPGLRALAVFEVDHPSTQAAKRRVLEQVLPGPPEHVRFVPCDFNQGSLESAMAAAGYDEASPTFILWEGVTNYLTEAAIDSTLRWCARAAAGGMLLFTYVDREVIVRPQAYVGSEQLFAALEKSGERFTWGIEPENLAPFLAQRGFRLEKDVGAAEYRERYFGAAARAMRGHEFYRVALAHIAPRIIAPRVLAPPIVAPRVLAREPTARSR